MTTVQNAKQLPKLYYVRHMTPGVVFYEGKGNVMVDRDMILDMASTAEGKPIYLQHRSVDMENLHNEADGYMLDCFPHPYDGWFWSRVTIQSDAGHQAVAEKWKVSNAYGVIAEEKTGGTFLNVPFGSKITKGAFTHMALTKTPRYEQADIFTPEEYRAYTAKAKNRFDQLHNSKPEGKKMFNLFKTNREPVTQVDAETQIELEGGKVVSIQEMINAIEAASKPTVIPAADQKVKVGDTEMTVADLAKKFNELQNTKGGENAGTEPTPNNPNGEAPKPADPTAVPQPQPNGAPIPTGTPAPVAPVTGQPVGGVDNKDHFKELSNAHLQPLTPPANIESSFHQLERGKALFSK